MLDPLKNKNWGDIAATAVIGVVGIFGAIKYREMKLNAKKNLWVELTEIEEAKKSGNIEKIPPMNKLRALKLLKYIFLSADEKELMDYAAKFKKEEKKDSKPAAIATSSR